MTKQIDKTYSPRENEDKIYQIWEESGRFNPDNLGLSETASSYTIILPPPNITDRLHMGHAAMVAIEDLLVRYKRLSGYRALWLPGTDHAAIATQNVVEKRLLKERGQTRHDLGRPLFLAEVNKFLKTTQGEILHQMRKLGASLDWSRLAFTLDESRQKAVRRMFKDMYEAGAIYRGERIVNWCPRCHSTLADDEVEYKEEVASLYWIKYGPFLLATTRPETKLGDTAVAVHPEDDRYKDWVGKEVTVTGVLGDFQVKVVADRAVDKEFGTGVIKVTPAHDFTDNEIAVRHGLPSKKIIDENGKMMDNCGKYAGLTTKEAREQIVADMENMGLIDHVETNYQHKAAVCYRCSSVIEPLPSKQWFVAVDKKLDRFGGKSLKSRALEVVKNSEVEFVPERFTKRYVSWMENLHDWCISRQIWFGHQIPVWYKGEEIYVGEEAPNSDAYGEGWVQDQDTLDTWFSSSLWTFSTLGWPDNFNNGKKSGDLDRFHPTQVLETGYEIITLWVSRMIMMSLFAVNEVPFKQVYLHGMILDKDGKKMSKSKGNGIDPIVMIEKFGADATRLSIIMGSTPGSDARFSEDKVEAKRNFVNKLWNVSRFILSDQLNKSTTSSLPTAVSLADHWILNDLNRLIIDTTKRLDNLEFSLAAEDLVDFTWNKLADWYLEIAKIEKGKEEITLYVLKKLLVLWHPYLPFVTETIWQSFNQTLLMTEKWPEVEVVKESNFEASFNVLKEVVIAIRNARSENRIEPAKKLGAVVYGGRWTELLREQAELIKGLRTGLESVEINQAGHKIEGAILIAVGEIEIYLTGAIDPQKEKERLLRESERLEKLVFAQSAKLENKDFVSRAPKQIVKTEQEKLENYKIELTKVKQVIENL